IALLEMHGITLLADIRTIPRSRHNPQFNSETLAESLKEASIGYRHMKALGGLRHARKDSPNTGWRNGGFRWYADYMQTAEFKEALAELIALIPPPLAGEARWGKQQSLPPLSPPANGRGNLTIMCAESVHWRCHRSLVADALTVRGALVVHIAQDG